MTSRNQGMPQKPDPVTGEPRPPKAPIYGRAAEYTDTSEGKAPKPPGGCSPTLEWHTESNASNLLASAFVALLMIAVLLLAEGVSWVGYWWVWVAVVVIPLIPYWVMRGSFRAAGAGWLRTDRGWVDTYDIILIRLEVTTKSVLTLQDSTKRGVTVEIGSLQSNRRLWDLVYNGMLCSIENGVTTEVNAYAQKVLKLPAPKYDF